MLIRACYLFLLLLAGLCFRSTAQEYSYIDYTEKDGLAGSTVYQMARDKDGFLWFGTETGLSRFDGSHFRNFYMSDGLPDNEIIKLFVDSHNRVWIVPFKNSLCYYQNGKIHNQQNDTLLRRLDIRSEVLSVTEDTHGDLIVAQLGAIQIISPKGKITTLDSIDRHPFGVIQVGIDEKGECQFMLIISGMVSKVATLDHDTLSVKADLPIDGEDNYTNTYLGSGLQIFDHQDTLVFVHSGEPKPLRIPTPKGFLHISRVDDSTISLNSYTSTYFYNIRQRKIVDSFLPGQMVNWVLEDPDGGLWFSTLGNGIHHLVTRDVARYSFREGNTQFPVFTIRRVGNTLYAGTDRFYLWSQSNGENQFRPRKIDARMSRGRITAIAVLDGKEIVAGTDAGVFVVDRRSGQSHMLWRRGAVKALLPLNDSVLIEFTGHNVCRLQWRKAVQLDQLWGSRATCGCVQGDRCFIGTLTGLYSVSLSKMAPEEVLFAGRISALAAAPDGGLWVATYGEGLVLWKDGRLVRRLTTEDGMTSNICRCLYVAGNQLWVGTDKGLNKLSPAYGGYIITPFTAAEGLGSDIINTIYVDSGKVYAGTQDGMTVFQEDKIVRRRECQLRMTGIHISGNSWPLDTANFTLPYNNKDLQFEYVGIAYHGSDAIRYRYRLLGIDERWATTDQTFLHYPSLPPGQYELQILAINRSGAISSTLQLPFSIGHPWWEWIWVRILFVLAIGGLVWVIFNRRVRGIRQKEAEKTATAARMAELEQMALRSRMNPHFIFNSLNSIQLFVMEKDIRGANEYITHFSRLIRQTLDFSARAHLSLQEEIDYLSTYLGLEKGRFEEAFDYNIFVAADIDKRAQQVPPMILQPYVENAILHGIAHRADKQGYITVNIRKDEHYLVCTIEDNGVGRAQAAEYKSRGKAHYPSRGMELTARRIDILNSATEERISAVIEDINGEDGRSEGTRVIVRLPL